MLDTAVFDWFQAHQHPALTAVFWLATFLHGTKALLLLSAALGLALWRRRERAWVLALVCSVQGAMLVNLAVKHLVRRQRPPIGDTLYPMGSYSFPSGHAAGPTAFYTFLAAWLLARPLQGRARVAVCAGAAALVAWVDVSRLYLGAHYFTDVVAGSAVGLAWVLLCLAALRSRLRPQAPGEAP